MKKFIILLIIAAFAGIGSCKKDDKDSDICSGTWITQVSDELAASIAAGTTYGTSPTTANCNAYKTATQNLINALTPFNSCTLWTDQQKTDFHDALDEAQETLNSLNCQ